MGELVAAKFISSENFSFVITKATPIVLRSSIETPVQASFGTIVGVFV